MTSILKKLFRLSFWNSSAAGINFMTNLLIVKIFGLAIFGDLAYVGSLAGIFSLVFLFIPSNYSIIKYQEDDKYKYLLTAFYYLASLGLFILTLSFQSKMTVPVSLFFLFAWTICFQSYFDISLQAENKLQRYYLILFFIALAKALFIGSYYFIVQNHTFYHLLLLITISQGGVILFLIILRRKIFLKSFLFLPEAIQLIWHEKKLFSSYYLSAGLKKINTNLLILLFEPFVGKEVIGIYALLLKVYQFIIGLLRTLESIFINKISHKMYSASFAVNAFKIGFAAQLIYLIIGLVYMKYLTGSYYFLYLLIFSTSTYLYLYFIKARANFLIRYQNTQINISYILFLVLIGLSYFWYVLNPKTGGLNMLVFAFISASFIQMIYLIVANKRSAK